MPNCAAGNTHAPPTRPRLNSARGVTVSRSNSTRSSRNRLISVVASVFFLPSLCDTITLCAPPPVGMHSDLESARHRPKVM
ncbi:hypothetical protein D3C77_772710 [compost metagenome]